VRAIGSATEPRVGTMASPLPTTVPQLSDERLLQMYETMVLSRVLDERFWILNRQGRGAFTISCQGHEAAQLGLGFALQPGKDVLFPYYRDIGLVLHFGMTPRDLMLGFFARAADPSSGGRQMPNHYGSAKHKIISVSSPVATQIPQATGAALASKLRHTDEVAAVCFGEGCTSSGAFHEGLNFASIHRLPVIFVCENNGWAISVPQEKQMAVPNVAERAGAYNMPGRAVDGTDPLAMYAAAAEAVNRARSGGGPTLIDARVCRLTPHSSDDDDRRYRASEELERSRRLDPLPRFRQQLLGRNVLDEAADKALYERVRALVDDAVEFAEASPEPDVATMLRHVFSEGAEDDAGTSAERRGAR